MTRPYTVDPETGCWVWQRRLNERGYPITRVAARTLRAHRHYYERARGPIAPGLELDHLCRNRACVNPDHLEPVTHAENVRRGRVSKLAPEAVARIRADYAAGGTTHRALAARFGVTHQTIGHIVRGVTWRPDPSEETQHVVD